MITLEWFLKTYEEKEWIGFIWLRIWATEKSCELSYDPSISHTMQGMP